MSELEIITNNVPREVIYGHELSAAEREDFDYHDWEKIERGEESDPQFFLYRGDLYDLREFQSTHGIQSFSPLRKWDGFQSDSYFSGVVVKWVGEDNPWDREPWEWVIVGRFLG